LPPPAVRTIRELIYWEFAKIVAEIALGNRKNFRYVMSTFQRFKRTNTHPLAIMRESGLESKGIGECAYCGAADNLEMDYVVPLDRNGPDRIDNQVPICPKCKSSKGDEELFHWYGKDRRYDIPRLVLARYLKLAYEANESKGTLDAADLNKDGSFDIYDLEAVFDTKIPMI